MCIRVPIPAFLGKQIVNENNAQATTENEAAVAPVEIYDQSWLTSLLRPVLIVVLVACMDVVLGAVVGRFAGGVRPGFATGLTLLAIGAALLGVVTTSVLAQPSQRINRSLGYRAAELGLLLAATRLYTWIGGTGVPSLGQMLEYPLDILLDPLFIVSAAIVGLSWFIASEVTEDLDQLALSADEIIIAQWRSDRNNDPMRARGIDRGQILSAFTMRWVTLGLLLIVLVATLRQGLTFNGFFALLRQDVEPAVMAAVAVYFLAGLLLLSHGRLATLRARWTLERTRSDTTVTRRWPLYVVLLVGAVALGALLLPFGGTFLLATLLSWLIGGLFALMLAVYRFFVYALLWLASWMMGDSPPPPPPPPPTAEPAAAPPAEAMPPLLPEWVGGSLFWVALVALVLYAAFVYFGEKGTGFAWLRWLWAALRRRWSELAQGVRVRLPLPDGAAVRAPGTPRPAWWNRRTYEDPDAQVRYLYFATLRAAEEAGLAREPSETPLRYAPRLEQEVAAAGEGTAPGEDAADTAAPDPNAADPDTADPNAAAVRALTDAFVTVRYAGGHADRTLAARLEEQWRALQRALRRRSPPPGP